MSKRQICILCILAVLIVAAVIAAACINAGREPERIVGEFTPPAFAQNAAVGTPDPSVVNKLPYGSLTLSETISVSMVSTLTVDENGEVEVWFTAPATNKGWVMLRLMDEQGNLLGETGLLKPGQYVQTITLDSVPKKSGMILARILTYEPDTYYSMGSASAQVALNVP